MPTERDLPGGRVPGLDDVSVSVVAHNAAATIEACLRGIADAGFAPQQVTVYDVASTDGTAERVGELCPDARVVRLDENLGPNPARSLAVTQSPTPFVLIMDADVQLTHDAAVALISAIGESERVGIVTPVVLYADRPETVQYRRTWIHYLAEASAETHDIPLADLAGRAERVGLASGCAPLVRKDAAIAVGLFEPRYFFGKTDGEFAYRVTIGGFDIVEPSAATALHHHRKRGSKFYKHQLCNRWHFMLKNFQLRTLLAILPILLLHEPVLLLLMLVMGKAGEYVRALGMLLKMLPTLPQDRRGVRAMRRRHDWQVLRGDRLVIPGNIDRGGVIGALASVYRGVLAGYWWAAQGVLAAISRPWPDGDAQVMSPAIPLCDSESARASAA